MRGSYNDDQVFDLKEYEIKQKWEVKKTPWLKRTLNIRQEDAGSVVVLSLLVFLLGIAAILLAFALVAHAVNSPSPKITLINRFESETNRESTVNDKISESNSNTEEQRLTSE